MNKPEKRKTPKLFIGWGHSIKEVYMVSQTSIYKCGKKPVN